MTRILYGQEALDALGCEPISPADMVTGMGFGIPLTAAVEGLEVDAPPDGRRVITVAICPADVPVTVEANNASR